MTFRLDADTHTYTDRESGEVWPSITQLLEKDGLIDSTWFTPESRIRGTAVHTLTADYDLGAFTDIATVDSPYKGFLAGYAAMKEMLRPDILTVEEAGAHPFYRFCGKPDRDLRLFGVRGNMEIKSRMTGPPSPNSEERLAHRVQLALQCILREPSCGIPAEHQGRWLCYLMPDGRFVMPPVDDKQDIDKAKRILRRWAC